jgi:hypothetical protein
LLKQQASLSDLIAGDLQERRRQTVSGHEPAFRAFAASNACSEMATPKHGANKKSRSAEIFRAVIKPL